MLFVDPFDFEIAGIYFNKGGKRRREGSRSRLRAALGKELHSERIALGMQISTFKSEIKRAKHCFHSTVSLEIERHNPRFGAALLRMIVTTNTFLSNSTPHLSEVLIK